LTQRPLTAAELAKARHAYQLIGECYPFTNVARVLVEASNFLVQVVNHGTSDGKPLRAERVPTAADIGKPVKVRDCKSDEWFGGRRFVGFAIGLRFVAQGIASGQIKDWNYCIIDEEAT
jgi:hypothetical protein